MSTKIRSQQVTIDIPTEDGLTWINSIVQTLIKNGQGEVVQRMDRTRQTHRILERVATETKTITDPVTGETLPVSAAGTATLVRSFILNWMQEDHGGTLIKDGMNNDKELIL